LNRNLAQVHIFIRYTIYRLGRFFSRQRSAWNPSRTGEILIQGLF